MIYCLLLLSLFVGVLCFDIVLLFSNMCMISFAIILMGKRELVALLKLSSWCPVAISVLKLFLAVPSVSLWCVIVVFPDHNNLLFCIVLFLYGNILNLKTSI